jgi:CDK-activating kinase assembly factor MAT1
MMINECGHPICQSCVEHIFSRNANTCPYADCDRVLKKNTFWPQIFDDPLIEKENFIRKRVLKIYNFLEDDFPTLKEYNDYLEHVEEIIFKLLNNEDIEQVEEEMRNFREEHSDTIEKNRRRLNADDQWIKEILEEESKALVRSQSEYNNDVIMDDITVKPRSIINELRDSNIPAEVILDRERKIQIEAELAEKEEHERKKKERSVRQPREIATFGPLRVSGKPYVHTPTILPLNGPVMPTIDELKDSPYLSHVRKPDPGALAAAFRQELACYRALFESRWDLFYV